MSARDIESALLARCAAVAREVAPPAQDQREANVFRLASMLIQSQFPHEANSLKLASDEYFVAHPNAKLTSGAIVRNGWIVGLPRLRDRLIRRLS
ncbi:hypothetical protein [Actimicrobium antarcticum]|uniref:Uncharacterized protein n=1 Tax=Actimicrobium antarcticum TaxID=1051899 RepID=A0ABP7SSB3_9BURK